MFSRRLVEFAFSTPQRLRVKGNLQKHVHREAMAGLLPDKIVHRRTKASFGICVERLLDKALEPVRNTFPQCSIGMYVDHDELLSLQSSWLSLSPDQWRGNELWAVFGLWVLMQTDLTNRNEDL